MRKPIIILFLLMLLPFVVLKAITNLHYVIVSGQVINYEYGSPVQGHPVYVYLDTSSNNLPNRAITELITDKEGFYYDSIPTTQLKGAFVIYTYDHYGKRIDTTLHFRFLIFDSHVILANFKIYMPYQIEMLQTRFKFVQKQHGNRFTYHFIDQTDNKHILSRQWQFGDGTTSDKKTITHIYKNHGFYKITLTDVANVEGNEQTNSFSRMIYISNMAYYNFGGHAFSEHFPIDYGVAYLYLLDSSQTYIPVDTFYIDTLGYYYFYQLPAAKYLVKAQPTPESEAYGQMLPTYYGDKLFWEDAKTIYLQQTGWEYDIHLQKAQGLTFGHGNIEGNISYLDGLKDGDNTPAKGLTIYLGDNSNVSLIYHYSDENGNFDFNNIALGNYILLPEITGIHAKKISLEINEQHPELDSIRIYIKNGEAFLTVPEQSNFFENNIGNLFPLPANTFVNLPIRSSNNRLINWQLNNINGQLSKSGIFRLNGGSNTFKLNILDLKNGFYILKLEENGRFFQRKLVVAR